MASYYTDNQRFIMLCSSGLLIPAQELYYINPLIDISHNYENAFRSACKHNHLYIAKWLIEINPSIDIHIWTDIVFHTACKKKYNELAKWLVSLINTSDGYYTYLAIAASHGNLNLVNYIHTYTNNYTLTTL